MHSFCDETDKKRARNGVTESRSGATVGTEYRPCTVHRMQNTDGPRYIVGSGRYAQNAEYSTAGSVVSLILMARPVLYLPSPSYTSRGRGLAACHPKPADRAGGACYFGSQDPPGFPIGACIASRSRIVCLAIGPEHQSIHCRLSGLSVVPCCRARSPPRSTLLDGHAAMPSIKPAS